MFPHLSLHPSMVLRSLVFHGYCVPLCEVGTVPSGVHKCYSLASLSDLW